MLLRVAGGRRPWRFTGRRANAAGSHRYRQAVPCSYAQRRGMRPVPPLGLSAQTRHAAIAHAGVPWAAERSGLPAGRQEQPRGRPHRQDDTGMPGGATWLLRYAAQPTAPIIRPHRACPGGAPDSSLARHSRHHSPPPGLSRWSDRFATTRGNVVAPLRCAAHGTQAMRSARHRQGLRGLPSARRSRPPGTSPLGASLSGIGAPGVSPTAVAAGRARRRPRR